MTEPRWYMVNKDGMATLCTSKKDAEKEARAMDMAWPHMGPHRAVQLVDAADVEAMRAGYAAARLEIESLKAQMAAHADELTVAHLDGLMRTRSVAPDPRPVVEMCAKALAEELAAWDIDPPLHHVKEAHDACELWLAAIDADRAMRVAQPAGALQPEDERAAFERWSKVTNQGYDLARNVSGKLQTFESTETEHAWRGFFHGLRASHGRAPAQAAPQQEATEALARAEYYIDNPSAWSSFDQRISDDISAVTKALRAVMSAPQPSPASHGDELDAARDRWLTADHHKQEDRVRVYEIASSMNVRGKGHIDAAIDAARAAHQEGEAP